MLPEYEKALKRWDILAKPLKGMGEFEKIIAKIVAINGFRTPLKKCVAVMCADNGVVCEGVTQTDSSITALVAKSITEGKSTVAHMAKTAGADCFVYDVGMAADVPEVVNVKVAKGTGNIRKEAAMTRQQAVEAMERGSRIVGELKEQGYNLIATGEMGIGNTTTSSALAAVLLKCPVEDVTGKGAGLSDAGLANKIQVIKDAIAVNMPDSGDVTDVLSKLGGYDIAFMAGMFLGGLKYRVPVVIDGLISSISALIAKRLKPGAVDYMIPSHMSKEPAAKLIMEELELAPVIYAGMALGEGTGAVAMMPLIDMAMELYNNMPEFADIHMEAYKPL